MAAVYPSSATLYTVTLEGGQPWGIRLQGGYEFAQKLRVAKVNPNSKAYNQGMQVGDLINSINGQSTDKMNHIDALRLFRDANTRLILELTRPDKQSVIPVLRVESPSGRRNSDSELLGGHQHKDAVTASVPSFQSSLSDEFGPHVTSRLETSAGQLSPTQPASVIWSPLEMQNLQTKAQLLPENPIQTMRHRRTHNISDPGFAPKHSLRPPISDSIQLSRRSRQFNFWTHLYPRNLSEPCIVTRTEPASDSSRQSQPPVFTSVDEFQKHYGSCYARTMPVKKRYPVRSSSRSTSAPGSPQMKRAQLALTESQLQPLHDDSTNFFRTVSSVSQGNTSILSPCTLSDDSLNVEVNKENRWVLCEPEPLPTSPSQSEPESDQGPNIPPDSVRSSLTVRLTASDGDKRKKDEMTKETDKTGWKTTSKLAKGPAVHFLQSADVPVKNLHSFGTTLSSDMNFGTADSVLSPDVSVATAKLKMIQSDQPALRSPAQTSYNFNRDVETCKNKNVSKISVRSTKGDSKHEMPSFNNSYSQITDAVQDISDSNSLEAEFLLNQRDWYKQIFKVLDKFDREPELPHQGMDKAEAVIPPRPKNTQNFSDTAGGEIQPRDSVIGQNREKSRMAKKGVEIPPCGLRFVSKPGRPSQNSEFKLNQPISETSSSSVSNYPSQEVSRTIYSMDLDLKRSKTPKISDDELLSPRIPDGVKKKDVENLLYTDKYWLELAGLANTVNREPAVIHKQARADKVAAKSSAKSFPCKALALYSFKAKSEKELSFDQGDIIYLIRPVDKNWFEAEHNRTVGFVPSNYIKVTAGSEETREKSFGKVIAKHSFTAKFPSELSFEKGDILTVQQCIDGNWFEGKLDHRTGIFPISYVEPFTVPVTSLNLVNPSAGLYSPVSVSRGSSVQSTVVPSGPASPHETYTSDYNPLDLEKSIFEFDKLVKNSQNLDIIKKDQSLNRDFNGGISEKVPVFLGFDIILPQCKTAAHPKCSLKTTCDLVISDGKIASDMTRMQDPHDQSVQSQPLKDPGSKMETARSTTPSLHLLYEEPWFQVLYNYKPQHDDELDLHEGDLIYLLEKCDDGWCVGQSDRTKRVGTFPRNYVTQLG